MEPIERLDRYLNNELSSDQLAELEYDLQQDPTLQQLLDDLVLSQRAVQIGTIRAEVGQVHKQFMHQLRNEATTNQSSGAESKIIPLNSRRSLFSGRTIQIAASVLFVLCNFAAYQFITTDGQSLYADNFVRYELILIRGNNPSLSVLENRYRSGDFTGVVKQGSTLTRKTVPDLFLNAMAHLELGQFKPAIDLLGQARKANQQFISPRFKSEIDYYQAMAYLADSQYEEALKLLEQIRQYDTNPYRDLISDTDLWKLRVKSWFA